MGLMFLLFGKLSDPNNSLTNGFNVYHSEVAISSVSVIQTPTICL